MKTNVIFLLDKNTDTNKPEVFAFFPDEDVDDNDNMRGCYAHVGQHSTCSIEYANSCQHAKPEQYKDLKLELESIGYNLEVCNEPKPQTKNNTYTPGPWIATKDSDEEIVFNVIDSKYNRVCTMKGPLIYRDANARLIATAPELLEALMNLTSAVVSGKARTEAEVEQAMKLINRLRITN